jgi:hypothetical protein
MVARWQYFFRKDQYLQRDYEEYSPVVDPNYPRPIAQDWVGLQAHGFHLNLDAAEVLVPSKVHFFKGQQYLVYDLAADKVDPGYPAPITNLFKGLPPGFHGGLDDVMNFQNGKVYLLKEEYCVCCTLDTMSADGPPQLITEQWPYVTSYGPEFAKGIDAAMYSGYAWFFKGSESFIPDGGYKYPITTYFSHLNDHDFDHDIQAMFGSDMPKKISARPTGSGGRQA